MKNDVKAIVQLLKQKLRFSIFSRDQKARIYGKRYTLNVSGNYNASVPEISLMFHRHNKKNVGLHENTCAINISDYISWNKNLVAD